MNNYEQKYLCYKKKYENLVGGMVALHSKKKRKRKKNKKKRIKKEKVQRRLMNRIISEFKGIEQISGNILYRERDNKYIILFGEHHEINSEEKTRIIEKIIEITQKYEIDIFIEEKFKFQIRTRFNPDWKNVGYLYDQIKLIPKENLKSRIHNIDIRDSFCYIDNYFHEYNYNNLKNIIKLYRNKIITKNELNSYLEIFEKHLFEKIIGNTDFSDKRNYKLINSGINKLNILDQERINLLIDKDYVNLRKKFMENLKEITNMIYDNHITEKNLNIYYIKLIDESIFFIYSLLMDIYTMIRLLKSYVKFGIFFGGEVHQENIKKLLTTKFNFIILN